MTVQQSGVDEAMKPIVYIVLGECAFKQHTSAISTRSELEAYVETIGRIIDSEEIWNDPDMTEFDVGEREGLPLKQLKAK